MPSKPSSKDPSAVALGSRGGRAGTDAQRAQRSAALSRYWADVRAGKREPPRRRKAVDEPR